MLEIRGNTELIVEFTPRGWSRLHLFLCQRLRRWVPLSTTPLNGLLFEMANKVIHPPLALCRVVDKSGKEVELLSSVDCKGIIGNDNRTYILDLLHTFPPDVNFMGGAPASCRPALSEEMRQLGYPYTHRHLLPSLRQELVDAFCE